MRSLAMMRSCLPPLTSSQPKKDRPFPGLSRQLVHRGTGVVLQRCSTWLRRTVAALLANDDVAAGRPSSGVTNALVSRDTDLRQEDGDIFVGDGIQRLNRLPVWGRTGRPDPAHTK